MTLKLVPKKMPKRGDKTLHINRNVNGEVTAIVGGAVHIRWEDKEKSDQYWFEDNTIIWCEHREVWTVLGLSLREERRP